VTAPALCTRLDWDSKFFGLPIARVTSDSLDGDGVAAAIAWCGEHGIRCLYYLSPTDPERVSVAEAQGFRLADVRLTLGCDLTQRKDRARGQAPAVRAAEPHDVEALRTVARTSFDGTRFFRDPGFPRDRSAALYETWVSKSCGGDADAVLVDRADTPAGFITCHLDANRTGRIGLLGVSPDARGRGIGGRLVDGALDYFQRAGAEAISVVTQGQNVSAQRLYQQAGFRTAEVRLWFHRWFQ